LGRLASDGEITAMRAAGLPGRRVLIPVAVFAMLAAAVSGACSLWIGPWALRETYRIVNGLLAEQLTAAIQPRVFEEQFSNSNTILYVENVKPGPLWQRVFIADLTPPEQRKSGLRDKAHGPAITIAREAIPVPDLEHNRIQLSLRDARTHEISREGTAYDVDFPAGEQALTATAPAEKRVTAFRDMDTRELPRLAQPGMDNWVEARIELHRRFALPLACIMLALVGVPLGIATRKGGRSTGYLLAIVLAFFCYYMFLFGLIGLAKQRTISAEVAVWLPNFAFAVAGAILLARMERSGDRDLVGAVREWLLRLRSRVRAPGVAVATGGGLRLPFLPLILDTYVLSQFLFYLALLLTSLVLLTEIYNFFELLSEMVRNKVAMSKLVTYLFFLTPKLIYDTLPISVLMAVLATFGVLNKNNEVIAFKASGVSLYRLSAPVLLLSLILSAGLFAFDYYYVPEANRRQEALRDEIKGKPVQTYLRPDRKWILGGGGLRIYYYIHLDPVEHTMVGVNVYELDPKTFRLVRHISAERAQWQRSLGQWIFQDGWRRDLRGPEKDSYQTFQATTFPELDEPPDYFLKELKQEKQMNFWELDRYINDLRRSGFDTVRLQVQFHKKFAVPLFVLIMAMLSVPFAFLVGNRGAMAGIGVSLGIAISYWAMGRLFEEVGNVSHLPPAVAAWSPDAMFALGGLYLLLKMRS
jgi:LPS export ABC transporter permease LptG